MESIIMILEGKLKKVNCSKLSLYLFLAYRRNETGSGHRSKQLNLDFKCWKYSNRI